MFCLRSWLPLLFIPTNASPAFILAFFICTYFLNRPCVYCSLLLLILFFTSCNWSDNCFLDTNTSTWFDPRTDPDAVAYNNSMLEEGFLQKMMADSVKAGNDEDETMNMVQEVLAEVREAEDAKARAEWTGLGVGWLRDRLGKTEWTVDCLDLKIKL